MRSGFERNIAAYLKRNKVRFKYEAYTYEYEVPIRKTKCNDCGGLDCTQARLYTPDFFLPNGVIVEGKGKFTGRDRTKMVLVRDQYPEEEFRLAFMYDNKLSRTSKTRYSDWATSKGFQYHVGWNIPEAWWKEKLK